MSELCISLRWGTYDSPWYEEASVGCNQRKNDIYTGTTEQVHHKKFRFTVYCLSAVPSLKIPVVSEKNKAVCCKLSLLIHAGVGHIFPLSESNLYCRYIALGTLHRRQLIELQIRFKVVLVICNYWHSKHSLAVKFGSRRWYRKMY